MKRIFTYKIQENFNDYTVSLFLKEHKYTSNIIKHLKRMENSILRNNEWVHVYDKIHTDDILEIVLLEDSASDNIVPTNLPIDIVYEDEDLLVVNKPANMPIHPSQGNYDNTLANAIAYYYTSQNEPFVYRCINRLDRDTTGLLIIAKNMYSASILSGMVKNREIHREYLAIASGKVPPEGTIIAPIARVSGSTIERCVNEINGEYACTHYKTLYSDANLSLVSLKLETGRTHQIRVHMKYIGHPLLGDFLYNPEFSLIERQSLHSHKLSFVHPITGETLKFEAKLPEDMQKLIPEYN